MFRQEVGQKDRQADRQTGKQISRQIGKNEPSAPCSALKLDRPRNPRSVLKEGSTVKITFPPSPPDPPLGATCYCHTIM